MNVAPASTFASRAPRHSAPIVISQELMSTIFGFVSRIPSNGENTNGYLYPGPVEWLAMCVDATL